MWVLVQNDMLLLMTIYLPPVILKLVLSFNKHFKLSAILRIFSFFYAATCMVEDSFAFLRTCAHRAKKLIKNLANSL